MLFAGCIVCVAVLPIPFLVCVTTSAAKIFGGQLYIKYTLQGVGDSIVTTLFVEKVPAVIQCEALAAGHRP